MAGTNTTITGFVLAYECMNGEDLIQNGIAGIEDWASLYSNLTANSCKPLSIDIVEQGTFPQAFHICADDNNHDDTWTIEIRE